MKKFLISYLTYTGSLQTVIKSGYDEQHVKNQLFNCKEVISIHPISEPANEAVIDSHERPAKRELNELNSFIDYNPFL